MSDDKKVFLRTKPTSKIVQTYYLNHDNSSVVDMVFLVLCEDGSIWVKECDFDLSAKWTILIDLSYLDTTQDSNVSKSKITRILKLVHKPIFPGKQQATVCVVECEDGSVWSIRKVANSNAWIRHIEPFDEEKGYE